MKKQQSGFTLIELMIVVAIIGVLAAVAIPQYQAYQSRALVSTALSAIAANKVGVENWVMENGVVTNDPTDIGVNQPSNGNITLVPSTATPDDVSTPDTDESAPAEDGAGAIVYTFTSGTPDVNGNAISLFRTAGGVWVCRSGDEAGNNSIENEFVPANCRTP
ncbi:pilin [Endozoicomonas numazuensis]|uniref:pilin n=1 Tax=Endozoicomonas numazuensis TaxID=1137799 RepID=UPI000691142D|nr:pilin [Endozoicomonas numazuensis]